MKLGIPETFAVAQGGFPKKKWLEVRAPEARLWSLALTLEPQGHR